MLDKIKSKSGINVDELIIRLKKELSVEIDDEELVINSLFDTLIMILNFTNLSKVPETLYSTWLNMTKDYWYLKRYDKLKSNYDIENDEDVNVKSVTAGDTRVEFYESNDIDIGTEIDKSSLLEKYKEDLYGHRVMRW